MPFENIKHLALIKINGSDAAGFLQGQLTNDIKLVSSENGDNTQWQISGYCNPKGRLLALLYLWSDGDDYYVLIDHQLREAITKRLQMYIMRSKVNIEYMETTTILGADQTSSLVNSGLLESASVANEFGKLTRADNAWLLSFGTRVLFVTHENVDFDHSAEGYDWLSADIEDGIPQITAQTFEQFIPQMINLDLLGGINFKKGCYTGQEIVARMHYLGNPKQRMFICDLEVSDQAQGTLTEGDKVFIDLESGKSTGQLVSVNKIGKTALAVLRLDAIENDLFLNASIKIKPRPGNFDSK
jgi:folate-binding protein YgfZ